MTFKFIPSKLMHSRYRFGLALSSLLTVFSGASLAVPLTYQLQLGVGSEEFEGDSVSFYRLGGKVNYFKGISRHSATSLTARVGLIEYSDSGNQDGVDAELEGKYILVPSSGFLKPSYSGALRLSQEDSSDETALAILLATTLRFNEEVTMNLGLKFTESETSDLDISRQGIFANLDYKLNENLTLYATYVIQDEETETQVVEDDSPSLRSNVDSLDIAGGHLCSERGDCASFTESENFDNATITLGGSYQVAPQHVLNLSHKQIDYKSDGGNDSTRNVTNLNYYYLF